MGDEETQPKGVWRAARLEDDEEELWVLSRPAATPPVDGLTAAEAEVVALAFAGLSNAQIAERRSTTVRTVANQLQAIYRKLGIHSRSELVHGTRGD